MAVAPGGMSDLFANWQKSTSGCTIVIDRCRAREVRREVPSGCEMKSVFRATASRKRQVSTCSGSLTRSYISPDLA